eukprot:15725-Rhodomonas_salina.1
MAQYYRVPRVRIRSTSRRRPPKLHRTESMPSMSTDCVGGCRCRDVSAVPEWMLSDTPIVPVPLVLFWYFRLYRIHPFAFSAF